MATRVTLERRKCKTLRIERELRKRRKSHKYKGSR